MSAAVVSAGGAGAGLVTVVIPTLNRPVTARAAIRSALDQAGVQIRLLVSDNCSDARFRSAYDELFASLPAEVAILRQPQRIPVERHFPHLLGLVETRFVVLLADDDRLAPTFVARALALAADRQAGAVFGPYLDERESTGRSQRRSVDYTHRRAWLRAADFLCRRNDNFIYGLFRTELLREAMQEFRPLGVLGRRTIIRIAYAPLLSCLLAAPYAHLSGEPVWIKAADSVKSDAWLGESRVMKLLELLLGEWVLAARFLRVARDRGGFLLGLSLAPLVAVMAVCHCVGFTLMAARRFAGLVVAGRQRA